MAQCKRRPASGTNAMTDPPPQTSRATALVALHGAVLLFGFAGLFGKWLALPPVLIVLGRTIVAAVALAALRAATTGRRPPFEPRFIGAGIVLALHWVAFFAAIQVSSVAIGLLGYASFPLFVIGLEAWLLRRRWSAREATTAALVTLGLLLLVPELSLANRAVQGLAWGVLSGLAFALLTVLNRRLSATLDAADVAFGQNLWAAVALLPLVGLAGAMPPVTWRDVGLLLVLGVVCTAGAHTLFIASLRHASAHTASVVAALEPVYGIALALLLQGEIPDARTMGGAALLVAAAVVASRRIGVVEPP
jgi:drug/metabolite transporter (DMT)-like permease